MSKEEIEIKQKNMLYVDLPNKLNQIASKLEMEVSENGRANNEYIIKKAYNRISEILEEYGYSYRDSERILSDAFDDTKTKIVKYSDTSIKNNIGEKLYYISGMIRKEADKHFEKSEDNRNINSFANSIYFNSESISGERTSDERTTERALEEQIVLELRSQIKRKLNIYEDTRGEKAFEDITIYLRNRFMPEILENYGMSIDQIKKGISKNLEEVIEEVKYEYNKEEMKETKKENDKLDLNELVNSPEETYENTKTREEQEKDKIEEKKKLPDLPSNFL